MREEIQKSIDEVRPLLQKLRKQVNENGDRVEIVTLEDGRFEINVKNSSNSFRV